MYIYSILIYVYTYIWLVAVAMFTAGCVCPFTKAIGGVFDSVRKAKGL